MVGRRQAIQVAVQMRLDLALGLRHEAQAQLVAQPARHQAQSEGARIPERIEQAGAAAELGNALRAPRKMVFFLARGALERLTRVRIARRQGLPLVERLRAHLAHMVDAHQRRSVPAVLLLQLRLR